MCRTASKKVIEIVENLHQAVVKMSSLGVKTDRMLDRCRYRELLTVSSCRLPSVILVSARLIHEDGRRPGRSDSRVGRHEKAAHQQTASSGGSCVHNCPEERLLMFFREKPHKKRGRSDWSV